MILADIANEPESITAMQLVLLFLFGGGLSGMVALLWKISKRDSIIDNLVKVVDRMQTKLDEEDITYDSYTKAVDKKIVDLEKKVIILEENQKNLMFTIDSQNVQIIDLIERLEKNQESYIDSQTKINDKIEASINAIKENLLNMAKGGK